MLNKTGKEASIIDDRVFNEGNENVALTKNAFANHVLNADGDFGGFDFSQFRMIFDTIVSVIERARATKVE